MKTELDDFDLRYISLGAGVQSTTLYLMALEGEIGPRPDVAIFADTQAEPPATMEHLGQLITRYGSEIPIHVVTGGSLTQAIERASDPNAGRFASVPFWVQGDDGRESLGRRQCTREYKIDVVKAHVRELLGLEKGQRAAGKYRVEEWIGISTDEASRAKPSRYPWITTRWPLLYDVPMRRQECKEWLEWHGYPIPPKSACVFCPFRSHAEWIAMSESDPESFREAVRVDEKIRERGPLRGMSREQYVHRSLRPLAEVIDDPEWSGDAQLDFFEVECEGMCGV